jgi:hypothetical protein
MLIVSLATENKTIVYERVAFIQNKKRRGSTGKWTIDQDQLFLLHNFPSFDGVSGIYSGQKEVALLNAGGQLSG